MLTPAASSVLSFMSQWGSHVPNYSSEQVNPPSPTLPSESGKAANVTSNPAATTSNTQLDDISRNSPSAGNRYRSDSRQSSRPASMIQTYQPHMMDVAQDTLPELQRIFTFLNSHSNKLYQEGYFLKLHDLDTRTLMKCLRRALN